MKKNIATVLAILCCVTLFTLTIPTSAEALTSTPLAYQNQSNTNTIWANAMYKGFLGAVSALIIGIITLPFRVIAEKNKKREAELEAKKAEEDAKHRMIFFCWNCGYTGSDYKDKNGISCPKCKQELIRTYTIKYDWDKLSTEEKEKLKSIWHQEAYTDPRKGPSISDGDTFGHHQDVQEFSLDSSSKQNAHISQMDICSKCGSKLIEGAKFCANCGEEVVKLPIMKYCRFCGSKVEEGNNYCPQCGKQIY